MKKSTAKDMWRTSLEQLTAQWKNHRKNVGSSPIQKVQRGYLYNARLGNEDHSSKGFLVLVLQTDHLNKLRYPSAVVVPCCDEGFSEGLLRVRLPRDIIGDNKEYFCMVDCVRMLNTVHFRKQLGSVPPATLKRVVSSVRKLMGP